MKKRFLIFILTIATLLTCVFGFSACKKVEFKINFVVEGNIYAIVSTSGNEVISMPENPTKDDYTFDGWYWDENTWEKPFTANSLLDAPLSSDMKVYAKFNKNHTHEYTPTTTEPTCAEKGLITYTCSCGDSYTEEIPATGVHTWDDGKITTEPTCTEKGVKTFTCTVCKTATYTEDVEALKHDEKTHQAKAPTCTEIGWEEYVTCEREGCEYSTYKEIPATGVHTWDDGKITTEPTCTEKGVKTFTCTVCKTATYTEDVEALKHDEKTHQAKAPTCTEIGWEEYITCEREGCDYSTYKEIPATGVHTWDKGEETKAPTCTKEGEMTYTCTVCKTATKTEPIDKLPHEHAEKWTSSETHHWHECVCGDKKGEEKHTAGAPATATTPQTCTVCGYVLQEETGILFNTLTVNGTKVYGKVSNTTTEFSFLDEVTVKGNATYVVDDDKDCGSPIYSKTVDLVSGDNTFYVLEIIGNDIKLFTVTIRRRPMHEVTFNANGGTSVEKQVIEEDYLATEPETTRTGYTFTGWDYDFTQPITQTTKITASWSANTDTKYTVNYYLQNPDDNEYTLHESVELKGETDTTATAEIKEYTHFTYNANKSVISGNINPEGSRVLSVYYTRDSYKIVVNTNNAKAGISTQINGTYKYDKEFTLTATTNAGYTWLGWYNGETLACATEEFTFKAEKDVTYTATWSANTDTKYIVNYYLQNLNDDEYTLHESVELKGETDTTVTAEIKEYTHFTYNASKSVISGNINGDGGQVLSVYYTRGSYKIVANNNNTKAGTSTQVKGTYKYDKEFTLTATTNAGYTWLGWYDGETCVCEDEEFTFKAEKDVTYTATWSTNVYNITYELNGGENHEDNVATYTIETATITLQTPTRTGYTFGGWFAEETFENKVTKITLGSHDHKTFYAKWTPTEYTITYHHNDGKAKEITSNSYTITNNSSSRWTESTGVLKSTNKTDSSSSVYKITANENITVSFEYKVSSEKNYDKLIIAKNGTALETVSGSTSYASYSVTLNAGEYVTFTYSKDGSLNSGDDCAYIKNLTYAPSVVEQVTTQAYNIETPAFDLITPTRVGYTFNGWFTEDTFENQVTEIPVGSYGDKVYYAKWSANNDTKYAVNYYLQNLEDDNYTLHETVELMGETDTTVTAEIKEYTHFTYKASVSTVSGNIDGDGSLVLNVYYMRNKYTISAVENNTDAGWCWGATGKYEQQITLTANTNAGYTWLGWYEGENLVCENEEFTFKAEKDVTYTATWAANTDTKYTVKYYLQNLDDSNYTLHETVEHQGMTDTTATAEIKEYTHFTYNVSKSTISGNINGDGGQVLSVYYTRNIYALTVNNTFYGTITNSDNHKYGKEIISTVTPYLGYEFIGWYNGATLLSTDLTYTFTVTQNVMAKFEVKDEMVNFNFTSTDTTCLITSVNDKTVAEIIVPDYVTSISKGAFGGCSSLESITIPFVGGSRKTASDTYQYPFGYIFGTSSYTGGKRVEQSYYGSSTSSTTYSDYYIPTSLKKVTVTGGNILYRAFYNCSGLTSIEIGGSVTLIEYEAFAYCSSLTSIEIPDSVTSIGDYAFRSCYSLTSITIPDSVISIGNYAFYYCSSLTSVVIPDSVTSIGSYAFELCRGLTSVVIGDSVTSIGESAFSGCYKLIEVMNKSTHITVTQGSSSNGYLGYYALVVYNSGSGVTESQLLNDNGYIFYTDGTEKILVGYNGTETDLVLPSYIAKIYKYAFSTCSSLTSIEIPDSVTSIGSGAFDKCDGLTSIEIPDSVTSIGDQAFYGCSSLTSVVIPDSVTSIGEDAFYKCSSLTSVVIPDSVTSIGYQAFFDCDSLTNVVIGDSVTSIGKYAFYHCHSLTNVVIGDSVTSIGSSAFEYCDSLTSVYYKGTASDWSKILINSSNIPLTNATRYYYSETTPALNADGTAYDGNYWHYDTDGITPVIWVYTKPEE